MVAILFISYKYKEKGLTLNVSKYTLVMRIIHILLTLGAVLVAAGCTDNVTSGKNAADEVISRFTAGSGIKVNTKLVPSDGTPSYKASVKDGVVTVEGSTPVAICKGFYDLVRESGAGIESWSGSRFDAQRLTAEDRTVETVSPYANHFLFNVVTYGYSVPYWDETRWDEEIDLMALHGYDMPLMLIAQEAITKRVLLKQGLTDEEIDSYFVGPAHLPWMRMGQLYGIDGPLDDEWHEGQLKLAHHVIDRMRALGMTPICPGFSGFVPQAIQRVHPEVNLVETSWSGGAFHNWMVFADQPLFKELGTSFIEEWEKEFGKCSHYLVDSFNEMDIPFADHGDPVRYEQLAGYGKAVYESIAEANPDAVWVMQGWMFGFQRNIWDKASLAALLRDVPDEYMLLLDLAVDYNYLFWHSEVNWEFYEGFFGKPWVFSVIPNMGGKNSYAGFIDFYANQGRLDALSSANKGNLVAYGYAAEGLESNELIYELVSDAGWTSDPIDVDKWLDLYQESRYGAKIVPNECWKSVYSSFTDHPTFFWQYRPGRTWKGSVTAAKESQDWLDAVRLNDSPLARADYAEMYAEAKGADVERMLFKADKLIAEGKKAEGEAAAHAAFDLMRDIDSKLASDFPTRSLDHWVGFARKWGRTPEKIAQYARNARHIVTVWGPPVDDYSNRLWSGLISGYYIPRWELWLKLRLEGKSSEEINKEISDWEFQWLDKD